MSLCFRGCLHVIRRAIRDSVHHTKQAPFGRIALSMDWRGKPASGWMSANCERFYQYIWLIGYLGCMLAVPLSQPEGLKHLGVQLLCFHWRDCLLDCVFWRWEHFAGLQVSVTGSQVSCNSRANCTFVQSENDELRFNYLSCGGITIVQGFCSTLNSNLQNAVQVFLIFKASPSCAAGLLGMQMKSSWTRTCSCMGWNHWNMHGLQCSQSIRKKEPAMDSLGSDREMFVCLWSCRMLTLITNDTGDKGFSLCILCYIVMYCRQKVVCVRAFCRPWTKFRVSWLHMIIW